eukprot:TRINITY_DN22976_c0_g1_i2.p1 TRINITY_DN22976_c0_g1~~TRINITY_DN22976_c0_g1_i2.p1  ORF type:complete len:230 (+),score=48.02 TRINITY_DN22976_c0_g1_i2:85-774(+)
MMVRGQELRVFLEAVRVVNAGLFGEMRERLEEQGCPASQLFAQCIAEGRHLADCAIQVHWGDAVPAESVGWHTDAPNSAVHMAISVFGKRVLHAELAGSEVAIDAAEKRADAQTAGDVYVACPATFSHGVEYMAGEWSDRMVAIQCRFLLSFEEMTSILLHPDCSFERTMMEVIGPFMQGRQLILPDMEALQDAERCLDQKHELPLWWKSHACVAIEAGREAGRACEIL